jgi:hypothetical protein
LISVPSSDPVAGESSVKELLDESTLSAVGPESSNAEVTLKFRAAPASMRVLSSL